MLQVISDTSPLQYLHQAGLLHLLPLLYQEIVVPQAVADELERGIAQGVAFPNVQDLGWARVRRAVSTARVPASSDLGPGKREVLAIASETPGSLAVLDDARARHYARLLGIPVTGTVGVLVYAKQQGHIEAIAPVLGRLDSLNFYLVPAMRRALLRLAGE